jgi:hypothetical protein
MINKFVSDFFKFYENIKKQQVSYITEEKIKEEIADFYKTSWLPVSQDFKEKFGESTYNLIENNLFDLYRTTKANVLVKKRLLAILKNIEPLIDTIQIEIIRKYGVVIEYDKKKQIIEDLSKYNFSGTLKYLKNSERDFNGGDWKDSCFNARLSLEEFMRELREKITKKSVPKGTLSNHINPIKEKIGLKDGEIKLIEQGFYGFLSEKGGHATKDIPDREDSTISIYLVYIICDYILKKYSKYI